MKSFVNMAQVISVPHPSTVQIHMTHPVHSSLPVTNHKSLQIYCPFFINVGWWPSTLMLKSAIFVEMKVRGGILWQFSFQYFQRVFLTSKYAHFHSTYLLACSLNRKSLHLSKLPIKSIVPLEQYIYELRSLAFASSKTYLFYPPGRRGDFLHLKRLCQPTKK